MAELHGWIACPRCRTDLMPHDGGVRCPGCGSVYYANSAPTASALVEDDDGRLLLARRAIEPHRGKWDTVGGFLHEGEDPLDGLRRELLEETGLAVEPTTFFGVWIDRYGDGPDAVATLNLFWRVRILGGELQPADDVAELAWFAPDELPSAEELAFSQVATVLAAWRDAP